MIWALNNAGGLAPRRQFSVKPFQVLPPQFDGIWFIHIISPVMVKATYGHSSKSEWGNAKPWKIRLALKHLLRFKTFHHASSLMRFWVSFLPSNFHVYSNVLICFSWLLKPFKRQPPLIQVFNFNFLFYWGEALYSNQELPFARHTLSVASAPWLGQFDEPQLLT